jgi:dTDP-4-amino-4,6-dideoxygalactose transaminase
VKYKIPLYKLNFDKKEQEAILETIKSGWISMGPKVDEFENKFSDMVNVKYSIAMTNCTSALHVSLKLIDINPGDEVICPSLTFVATINAIRYVNAIPVFADIKNYEDLTIDPNDIEKKITEKTKAIVVMHYGGFACQMDSIMNLAEKYNLKVIEDACHGPLSEYKEKNLGTIGDIGCFSFFSNKNISTGEGGMLVTNNFNYYEKAKFLRSHGMTSLSYERSKGHSTTYDVIDLGYNYRMDDIRASIGIEQLSKLRNDIFKRIEVRNYYINKLSEIEELIIPFKDYVFFSSNYIFPIILKDSTKEKRDLLRNKLHEAGIQTSVHYPPAHLFSIYKKESVQLNSTEYVSNCEITLPMYSQLSYNDINYICKVLKILFTNAN